MKDTCAHRDCWRPCPSGPGDFGAGFTAGTGSQWVSGERWCLAVPVGEKVEEWGRQGAWKRTQAQDGRGPEVTHALNT